jgi:hypothetical protein
MMNLIKLNRQTLKYAFQVHSSGSGSLLNTGLNSESPSSNPLIGKRLIKLDIKLSKEV